MIDKQKLIDNYQERVCIVHIDGCEQLHIAEAQAKKELYEALPEEMTNEEKDVYFSKIFLQCSVF